MTPEQEQAVREAVGDQLRVKIVSKSPCARLEFCAFGRSGPLGASQTDDLFWYALTLPAMAMTALALLMLLVPTTWVPRAWGVGSEGTFVAVLAAIALTGVYFRVLVAITRGKSKLLLRLRSRYEWLQECDFADLLRATD